MFEMENLILGAAAAASAFIVVVAAWMSFRKPLIAGFEAYGAVYRRKFVLELQYPTNYGQVMGAYLGVTVLLFVFFALNAPVLALFIPPLAWVLPGIVYRYQKAKRRQAVDHVLPNVLQQLSASTKTIDSISVALQEVADTAPKPMDYELALISRQEQELKSFPKALENARGRLNSKLFDIVTAVLQTAEEKGGRTSSALDNLSRTFMQLQSMQNKLDTATSEGRISMKVMMGMPFFIIAVVYMVDPGIVALATVNMAGYVMLGLALFFYLLAVGLAIYFSSVEV